MGFVSARRDTGAATCARLRELVGTSHRRARASPNSRPSPTLLDAQDYATAPIIDPLVVRGLAYYTGPVYEAELTFEITDEDGQPRQFGSVAGGGRYDDLVKRFTGQAVPATGISIGVDRLLAALREIGRAGRRAAGPVVILAMDRDQMAAYQSHVRRAAQARHPRRGLPRRRQHGQAVEIRRQTRRPPRRSSRVATSANAAWCSLRTSPRRPLAAEIESNEEWKAQPAQREVPRAGVLATVREMLAR